MLDLAQIRTDLCTAAAQLDGLNCYPYPDPQPEFPAFVLGALGFDAVQFHASMGCEGAQVTFAAELWVADADTETAQGNIEVLIPLASLLEAATSAAFVNVVVHTAGNVRRREQSEAVSCELRLTVHA